MLKNRRNDLRFNFRAVIEYQKINPDGTLGSPKRTITNDLSVHGLSFQTEDKLEIESLIKIKMFLPGLEQITFKATIRRILYLFDLNKTYEVGVGVENLTEEAQAQIASFIQKMNIFKIIDSIDLNDVMDIHFVSGYPLIVKRSAKLEILKGKPFSEKELEIILLSLLNQNQYQDFITQKEFNSVFSCNYREKKEQRFRLNLHFQRGKLEGVLRVIPSKISLPTKIGLPSAVENILLNKNGLVVVAGRTGAGKTTTIASLIQFLNKHRKAIIISIENPIEFLHSNDNCIIKQREVGGDTKSFRIAAKNALRQNPDILIIGEILDKETMEIALSAAESGTLVLTSMHAPTTEQALDRITSFFQADIQPYIRNRLSLILRGIITQDLFPRLDGKGLAVAVELLLSNVSIRHLIRKGYWHQIPTTIEMGRSIGMKLMQESVTELYEKGLIDQVYLKNKELP